MFLSYINTLSSAILSYSSITFRGKVIQGEKNGKGREERKVFVQKKQGSELLASLLSRG